MEASRSLLYSTSPFHARAIARSCLPSSPAASPVSYLNEQTTLAASAGSATLLARTSPVSMPLQEQRDAYKPLFRMLKQDTIPQVKYKARTAVKEKREKNRVQPELLFQDQHGHLPTLWDSQGFNLLSAGMDQSELTADNELSNAVDLAKIALSASKEAALSADLELLGANSDDADLVDHNVGEIKTIKSTRHLERKSKRRKTPISNIFVPETHNSKRVDVKKKLSDGFDQNDPLRLFLWGPETRQLLTLQEESELILHIQVMLKLEQLKSKLESQFRREPTLIEWAEAADLSCRVLKAQLHSGNRSREKLINANLRMVVHIAKHYQGKGLSLQDLMQVGSMGLVKSVEKFNPQVGCRFGTYAYWWIRQTVRKSIFQHSRTIRLPENVYGLLNKISEAKRLYDQEGVRCPSKEEIAKRVGITVERMDKLMCMARTPISMQQTVWSDQETTYQEITADPGVELPDMSVSKQLMRKHVRSLLSILNPRERRIIKLRYGIEGGHQKSLSEIGDVFGLTKERVRQLESRALNKLKECLTTHGLGAYGELLV